MWFIVGGGYWRGRKEFSTLIAVFARTLYCSRTFFWSSSEGILKRVMRSTGAIFWCSFVPASLTVYSKARSGRKDEGNKGE